GALASGMSGLPFLEIVGKTIPAERRGEFFAWRFGLGGLFSIGASVFVRWLIDPAGPLPFPSNYGLLSGIFFVAASVSLLLYHGVQEPADTNHRPRASFSSQLKQAFGFFKRDGNYRSFISMQSTLMIAGMATPFYAVFVQQQLGGSKAMVGVYLGITMVGNLLANILFGRMSRRMGNRKVMLMATLAGGAMSILVLLLAFLARPLGLSGVGADLWLAPVFILSALRGTGIGVAANSLLLDISPVSERSVYMGFNNTFQGIVLLFTSVSGFILATIGFIPLVIITLAAHAWALFSASRIQLTYSPQPQPQPQNS
ncbi:MAG TPA: MFS transporter, partial [Anaerolineaceae bacterium]|nr:MFS transporter [Anaerolineaceae bacterium]